MNIYKDILIEHYRYPRNRGELAEPDFSTKLFNPSCGDSIFFQGTISVDVILKLRFQGQGCVISQAVASLLAEKYEDKKINDVLNIDATAIQKMIGMELGPMRLKCALLPLEALQEGLKKVCSKGLEYVGSCEGNESSSGACK